MTFQNSQENDHDLTILNDIVNGNQDALTLLYDRYASQILAVTFHIIRNKQEAEDLVHDVFIEAWQKAKDFDPRKGTVRNWLFLRARSRSIDRIRKLARTETRSEIEEVDLSASDIGIDQKDSDPFEQLNQRQTHTAIDRLAPEHALLIKASYFEDLSYREIARKYKIPEGTVKSRMLAAFKILRKQLVSTNGGEEWVRT